MFFSPQAEAREDRPQPAQPAQPDRAEPSGKQKRKDRHRRSRRVLLCCNFQLLKFAERKISRHAFRELLRRRKDDGPEAEAPETRDPARRRSKGSKAWKLSLKIGKKPGKASGAKNI